MNSHPTIRWNWTKAYLRDLQTKGFPVVPTLWVSSQDELEKLSIAPSWQNIVVKPEISAGAFLTYMLEKQKLRAKSPVLQELSGQGTMLIQPFRDSVVTLGEYSLVYFNSALGMEFSHAVLKRPTSGYFRVQEKYGGNTLPCKPEAKWFHLAERALKEIPGDWLYARIDLVAWDGEPVLGEIEAFEPDLYLRYDEKAPEKFARHLQAWAKYRG